MGRGVGLSCSASMLLLLLSSTCWPPHTLCAHIMEHYSSTFAGYVWQMR